MNFSYSTLADIFAVAEEQPQNREALLKFEADLEQTGIGTYEGKESIMNPHTNIPDEIISMEDYRNEIADQAEDDGLFDYIELATSI